METMKTGYVKLPIERYDELMNTEKNWLNSCVCVNIDDAWGRRVMVNFGVDSEKAKEDFRPILAEVKAEFDKIHDELREQNEELRSKLAQIKNKPLWKKLLGK